MDLQCIDCGERPKLGDDVLAQWSTDGACTAIMCLYCYAEGKGIAVSTLKAFLSACTEQTKTTH